MPPFCTALYTADVTSHYPAYLIKSCKSLAASKPACCRHGCGSVQGQTASKRGVIPIGCHPTVVCVASYTKPFMQSVLHTIVTAIALRRSFYSYRYQSYDRYLYNFHILILRWWSYRCYAIGAGILDTHPPITHP